MAMEKTHRVSRVVGMGVLSLVCIAFATFVSGCCNISAHCAHYSNEPAGIYRGTRECSDWIVCAFPRSESGISRPGNIYAFALLPVTLLDWPFEVVADTITFPYDFCVWALPADGDKSAVAPEGPVVD